MSDQILDECLAGILTQKSSPVSVKDYNAVTSPIRKANENYSPKQTGEAVSPHVRPVVSPPSVIDCITEAFGQTPLLRLHRIEKLHSLTDCELYAKLEFMSAGGSVKDRIGRRMVEDMLHVLKKGDYIIEATSGNAGIALALMCAVKGLRMVVLMPQKMSMEKENTLTALGARVIRTRNSAAWNDPDSHIALAGRLADALNAVSAKNGGARAYFLDQYATPSNLEAHYHETATEILEQIGGQLDYFVAGIGTGGTFSGISRRLKAELPTVKCIAIDPKGSVMHYAKGTYTTTGDVKPYEVEGVGYDFHPSTWHRDAADDFEIVNDQETFSQARELIREEGVLCGGSSGLAVAGAIKLAKRIASSTPAQKARIVVILPDGIRNYLSKFVSDDWMLSHNVFQKPEDHRMWPTLPLQYPKTPCSGTAALKCHGDESVQHGLKALYAANGTHVAALCPRTHKLLVLLSKADLEAEMLKGNGHQKLSELTNANSLYFIPRDMTDDKDSLCRKIHCVLRSQFGEGKLKSAAVILVEPLDLPSGLSAVERRNCYANLDWSKSSVDIVSAEHFIKGNVFCSC